MAKNYDPRDELSYYVNNASDVKLSMWEYHDFIDCVLDDRLTAEGLMKFKRMYQLNSLGMLIIPTITFPIAYICQKWMHGKVFCEL